jgi:hypothetical protein
LERENLTAAIVDAKEARRIREAASLEIVEEAVYCRRRSRHHAPNCVADSYDRRRGVSSREWLLLLRPLAHGPIIEQPKPCCCFEPGVVLISQVMARLRCPSCGAAYDDARERPGPFHFLVGGVRPAASHWIVSGVWLSGVFVRGESLIQGDEPGRLVQLDEVAMETPANEMAARRSHRNLLAMPEQAARLAMHHCLWSTTRSSGR